MVNRDTFRQKWQFGCPRQLTVGGDDADAPSRKPLAQHGAHRRVKRKELFFIANTRPIGRVDYHQTRDPLQGVAESLIAA